MMIGAYDVRKGVHTGAYCRGRCVVVPVGWMGEDRLDFYGLA